MDPDQINAFCRRRPFLPFRIVLVDGTAYDVTNPEFVALGRTALFIGVGRDPASPYFDEPVVVALRHVVGLQPLVDLVTP